MRIAPWPVGRGSSDPEELAAHTARASDPAAVAQLSDPRCITWWLLDASWPVGDTKLNTGDAQTVEGLTDGLEIEQLYVRASHLGQGLGILMLRRAKEAARELALRCLWLGVWERNERAIGFYERVGFEAFAAHDFLLGRERQRDVLMRLVI